MWTQFMDMHSGGGRKEKWQNIYIEAPEAEARSVFFARFGHSPDRVTCTCCGEDYSVSEYKTLEAATEFERCGWSGIRERKTLAELRANTNDFLFIGADEISDHERSVDVPAQGFVWID